MVVIPLEHFNSFGAKFQMTFVVGFFILTYHRLERCLYVKLRDWMSNSIDLDETAHWASQLDLCCLQKSVIIACGSERVNAAEEKWLQSYKERVKC